MGKSAATRIAALALVFILAVPACASAEIPHENFNLIGSSLDVIVQMLNQSINATELALVSCLDDRSYDGEMNLSLVDAILEPVGDLIATIQETEGVETNLTYLIPPFENLSEGGHGFIDGQSGFLLGLDWLRLQIGKNLTPIEAYYAQKQLIELTRTVALMNDDLDVMDAAADEIANLTVEGEYPFDTTYLKELIDRLRMTLEDYLIMLEDIFWRVKWIEPFITLGMTKNVYYLGETVLGIGFVFDGEKPLANATVYVDKDNASFNFTTATTNAGGRYTFAWEIPIDPAELGDHSFMVRVWMNNSWYMPTEQAYIGVEKIPTFLSVTLNSKRFSPEQTVNATAYLRDYKGGPVLIYSMSHIVTILKGTPPPPEEIVELILDDSINKSLATSGFGYASWSFPAIDLPFGTHSLFARFNGSAIYQPSMSGSAAFEVNYLTTLSLNVSPARIKQGGLVNVTASLRNSSQHLSGRTVLVYFDESVLFTNKTGVDGDILYMLNTTNISTGTHVLRGYFSSQENRYASAESDPAFLAIYVESSNNINPPPDDNNNPNDNQNNPIDWLTNNLLWIILIVIMILMLAIVLIATDTVKNVRDANLRRKTRAAQAKILAKGGGPSEMFTLAAPPAASGVSEGVDYDALPPKTAIVMLYTMLLSHLTGERKMGILPTMTARDIARMLVAREFPSESVGLITNSFERAKYSAETLTRNDWKGFERAVAAVQGFSGVAA
jgi:hypothetical protein